MPWVELGGHRVETSEHLRFLGLKVTNRGTFTAWRDDFTTSLYGVRGRLTVAGLGGVPGALVKGVCIKTVPAMMYGCEIWASTWVAAVLAGKQSPYKHIRFDEVTKFFKSYLSLPINSFGAAVFRLLNIPSVLQLVLPRMAKLLEALSAEQWQMIEAGGGPICKAWVCIRDRLATLRASVG